MSRELSRRHRLRSMLRLVDRLVNGDHLVNLASPVSVVVEHLHLGDLVGDRDPDATWTQHLPAVFVLNGRDLGDVVVQIVFLGYLLVLPVDSNSHVLILR